MKNIKEKEFEKVKIKRNYIIISSIIAVLLIIFFHIKITYFLEYFSKYFKEGVKEFGTKNIISKLYWIRAIVKIIIFMMPMLLYKLFFKESSFNFLSFKNKINKKAIYFSLFSILFIFLGFYLIKNYIDMDKIIQNMRKIAFNKTNYIFMYIYIFTINAFLEEMFFRGYLFLKLSKFMEEKHANIFSAFMFGIYHIGITGELSFKLGIISVIGLFIVGYIFNLFNKDNKNIYSSYLIHASSNIAINTIGLIYIFL